MSSDEGNLEEEPDPAEGDDLQPPDTIPREFIRNILLSDKILNKRTYSVEQSCKSSSPGSGAREPTARPIKRTSAPIFNRHNSFGYVPIKPRRSLPVTSGMQTQMLHQATSTSSLLQQPKGYVYYYTFTLTTTAAALVPSPFTFSISLPLLFTFFLFFESLEVEG